MRDAARATRALQRAAAPPPDFPPPLCVCAQDYEIGNGIWPVQRNRTLFVTSLVPVSGEVDTYRAWWGAADANVATGIVKVTYA